MDVLDYMSSRFISEIHEDFVKRLRAGELATAQKRKKAPRRLRGGAFCEAT